jgi:hypothetical protein
MLDFPAPLGPTIEVKSSKGPTYTFPSKILAGCTERFEIGNYETVQLLDGRAVDEPLGELAGGELSVILRGGEGKLLECFNHGLSICFSKYIFIIWLKLATN